LFKISQHHFSGELGFAFLACSEREGDFCDALNGKGRFQKEVKGDFEPMRINVRGLIELFLVGEKRKRYGTYFL